MILAATPRVHGQHARTDSGQPQHGPPQRLAMSDGLTFVGMFGWPSLRGSFLSSRSR